MIKKVVFIWCWLSTFGEVMANGYVVPLQPHDYQVNLANSNLVNQSGFVTSPFIWDLNGTYSADITCPQASIPSGSPVFYKSIVVGNPELTGNGFVKLNDYLDMKVEIFIAGGLGTYVPAPFTNVSNLSNNSDNRCTRGLTTRLTNFATGGKGRVTFRVRKPIINGIKLADRQIVELFGRLGNTVNTFGSIPMSRVIITSALLYVPEKCIINGGATVQVEFGELPQSGLDGSRYAKQINFPVKCSGGSFDPNAAFNINFAISGKGASFSSKDLRTARDGYQGSQISNDLAIRFSQLDGRPLPLGNFVPVNLQGGQGVWGFVASPVQSAGSEVAVGDFYATATVVAAFP